VHAACFAMLAYIGRGGTLEPMLVVARAGLAASELWELPTASVVVAARLLTLTHVLLALLRCNAELSAASTAVGHQAFARGRALLSRVVAAGALFVLLLASPAVSPVGLALPMLLDAIALINWAVDPKCSLWLSQVRTALVFVAMLGPTAKWACLRGAFGPPDAWAYWDHGTGPADALASLPSVGVLMFVANIAHGLAGGAAYVLRPEAASNSLLVSSALTLLIECAIFALPAGEFSLRTAASFFPFNVLDCDLSSPAGSCRMRSLAPWVAPQSGSSLARCRPSLAWRRSTSTQRRPTPPPSLPRRLLRPPRLPLPSPPRRPRRWPRPLPWPRMRERRPSSLAPRAVDWCGRRRCR